jgi:hypothetical protein
MLRHNKRTLRHKRLDDATQRRFIAAEALDDRRQDFLRIKPLQMKRVTGELGEQRQKGQLRATVAFPKGMNRIELGQEMSRTRCECIRVQAK